MADFQPPASWRSAAEVDKDLITATLVPDFDFNASSLYRFPLVIFRCRRSAVTCTAIKRWLKHRCDRLALHHSMLRIETQHIHELDAASDATLLWMPGVAQIKNVEASILAGLVPKDHNIRWCYSVFPMDTLMVSLDAVNYITLRKVVPYDTRSYQRLLTVFREEFLRALQVPHSPDCLNAMALTDYAPEVLDHEAALVKLSRADILHTGEERETLRLIVTSSNSRLRSGCYPRW